MPPPDGVTMTDSVDPQAQPATALPMAASPDAMGVQIGQGVVNEGMVAARIGFDREAQARAQQAKIDQIGASNAIYASKTADQSELHGDGGVFTQNPGLDAPKVTDAWLQKRAERNAKVRDSLPNDQQKESFDLHQREQDLMVHGQVDDWQSHQLKQADSVAFANSGEVHYNDAMIAAANADPIKRADGVNSAIAKGSMDIIDYGRRNGWTNERTTLATQEYASHVSIGVLKTLVDSGDGQAAKQFHEDHSDDFLGDDAGKASLMVKASNQKEESRDLTIAVLNRKRPDGESPNFKSDLADLDARSTPGSKEHDDAAAQIANHYRIKEEAEAGAQRDAMKDATDQVNADGNANFDVSPTALLALSPTNRRAVEAYQKQKRAVGHVETDETTKEAWLEKARDPSKWDDILKEPPEALRPKMNDVDYNAMLKEREHIQAQVKAQTQQLSQGMISAEVTAGIRQTYKMEEPKDKDPNSPARAAAAARWNNFQDQLQRMNGAQAVALKRPLLKGEIEANAKALFATTTWQTPPESTWEKLNLPTNIGPRLRGDAAPSKTVTRSAPFFESPNASKAAYRIDDVPEAQREALLRSLEKGGLTKPTDRQLIKAYNLRLGITNAAP